MELRGIQRLGLQPGETRTVNFKLNGRDLQMLNRDMHWVVEPRMFDLRVWPSSAQTSSVPLEVVWR